MDMLNSRRDNAGESRRPEKLENAAVEPGVSADHNRAVGRDDLAVVFSAIRAGIRRMAGHMRNSVALEAPKIWLRPRIGH